MNTNKDIIIYRPNSFIRSNSRRRRM